MKILRQINGAVGCQLLVLRKKKCEKYGDREIEKQR
jgi:hypothetical protein